MEPISLDHFVCSLLVVEVPLHHLGSFDTDLSHLTFGYIFIRLRVHNLQQRFFSAWFSIHLNVLIEPYLLNFDILN